MSRNLLIMISVSLGFFFVTATTFTSLGYVLYTMVAELGWSQAAAGASFSLLGLACGLSSPLPPLLMKWVGTRFTMFAGGLVLAAAFLLASLVSGIGLFFVATILMGIGFSLVAPSPAIYLIATWFPKTSARLIGFYFMAGALGGVVGPLIVGAIVGASGSWRVHWMAMAVAALVLGVMFLFTIRDAVRVESTEQVKNAGVAQTAAVEDSRWTVRQAMMSRSFVILAIGMMVIQTVVTTMHSVLVTHVAGLGGGSAPGALAMSLLALTGTFAKGISGALSERIAPKTLFAAGLALQCGAVALLCLTATPGWAVVFALIFGLGWGFSWLSAHVLLLRYFGSAIAGDLTAMATMATTFAVLGPLSAGWVADRTGSFVPMFLVFTLMLAAALLLAMLLLRAPKQRTPELSTTEPMLVPAE
ncbi:MFS transporter [Sphingomonas sp. DT-204]|uniref:MFS transporter n=1 Tax=Sphingomonas sp. DT-204 TaxID=3396166 RepID=UPI003F1B72D7